jgi:F0F1-type ATP synthase epsilon subunit
MLRIVTAEGTRRELFLGGGFAQWVGGRLTVLAEEALESEAISPALVDEAEATLAQPVPHADREYEAYERLARRARLLRRLRGLSR